MLKKAGIIVATAAAGLLAVSPLAFAGDHDGHDGGSSVEGVSSIDHSNEGGLLNLADNNVSVPVNACDNQVPVNVLGVQVPLNNTSVLVDLTGALGLGVLGGNDTDADSGSDSDGDDSDASSDNTVDDSCTAAVDAGDSAEIDD